MRIQWMQQRYFDFGYPSGVRVVDAYRRKYQTLSELLDPQLLELTRHDWMHSLSDSNKRREASGEVSVVA